MTSANNLSLADIVAKAIAGGTNGITALRNAKGYSVEDLAITCGLASGEIIEMESSDNAQPEKLRRIAASVGMPEIDLSGASIDCDLSD